MASLEQIKADIEENRPKVYKKDFTFYNIAFMATLAKVTEAEGCSCARCRANMEQLYLLSNTYPELIGAGEPGKRKLEDSMDGITDHLCKDHGYSRRYWYKSLYSLYGFVAGMAAGIIAALLAPDGSGKTAFLVAMLLVMAGAYIYGSHRDFLQEKNKKIL